MLWPGLDWAQAKVKFARTMAKSNMPVVMDQLFDELIEQTELWLTWGEQKQVEGRLCQVILMRATLEYEGSLACQLSALTDPYALLSILEGHLEFEAELTGELLWDLASGHFRNCSLDVDYELGMRPRSGQGRG